MRVRLLTATLPGIPGRSAEKPDVVRRIREARDLYAEELMTSEFTLGGDATVAAGPVLRWTNRTRSPKQKAVAAGPLARKETNQEMNWDEAIGKWKDYKGRVREKWGELTDDDLEVIAGKRDQLIGRIQHRYGIAREAAKAQVEQFERQSETLR